MAARFVAILSLVAAAQAGAITVNSGLPLSAASLPISASGLPLGTTIAGARIGVSPLGASIASPYGLPLGIAGARLAAPLGVASPYGLPLGIAGARLASPLGVASPLLAQRIGAPLGVASPLLAQRIAGPLGAPLVAQRLAAPIGYAAGPIAKTVVGAAIDTDYDPNPSYSYAYDVQDALTGDSKNQQESRQGDVVQGSYSLVEPDGTRRTVEYTADPINGFNAVVHREPLAVAKTVVAAPAIARVGVSPLGYASPLGLASPLAARTIIG